MAIPSNALNFLSKEQRFKNYRPSIIKRALDSRDGFKEKNVIKNIRRCVNTLLMQPTQDLN